MYTDGVLKAVKAWARPEYAPPRSHVGRTRTLLANHRRYIQEGGGGGGGGGGAKVSVWTTVGARRYERRCLKSDS
jgi:hypothetical protein